MPRVRARSRNLTYILILFERARAPAHPNTHMHRQLNYSQSNMHAVKHECGVSVRVFRVRMFSVRVHACVHN